MQKKILQDSELARQQFEMFERIYRNLKVAEKKYLKSNSIEYKKILASIQEIILPTIQNNCSVCKTSCCRLYGSGTNVYAAGTVGCFKMSDFLLVRCDTILPEPKYENAKKNLCPFWAHGCMLPLDGRSFTCVQYFCDNIAKELDMKKIARHLEQADSIVDKCSPQKLLFSKTSIDGQIKP